MRLLIVTFDPPDNVGGVENRLIGYTRQLPKMGHFVQVVSLGPGRRFTRENFNGTQLYRFPSSSRYISRSLSACLLEVHKQSIDSLFLLTGGNTFLGVLLLLYAKIVGLRSAAFYYGKDILGGKRHPLSSLLRTISEVLAQRIATNSFFTAGLIHSPFRRKVRVLYPGVDLSTQMHVSKESGDEKKILFVGRLIKRKGVDDLLLAFRSLLRDVPSASLEIVGDGPEMTPLRRLTERLGIAEKVNFMGSLRGGKLYERYASAGVVVMPSKRTADDVEGFGTIFLEAAAFAKPVVGTISGGIPEAVRNGETGLLVQEGDIDALKASLVRILGDSILQHRLGRNGLAWVLSNFSLARSASSVARLFGSIEESP